MDRNDKAKSWALALLIGAAVGSGAYWLIRRQRDHRSEGLPALPGWRTVLVEKHGAEKADMLMQTVEENYAVLLHECAMPAHPALRRHLKGHILPGLALYRTLLVMYGGDREAALAEIDMIFRAWTLERSRGLAAAIKVLPMPFWLFKFAAGVQMQSFPPEGWDFQYIEMSDTRIAFNATRCFYLNMLTALGAPELTASFCKTDDVMAELFPDSVRFVRPQTLGRGDTMCDFQYCRADRFRQV